MAGSMPSPKLRCHFPKNESATWPMRCSRSSCDLLEDFPARASLPASVNSEEALMGLYLGLAHSRQLPRTRMSNCDGVE